MHAPSAVPKACCPHGATPRLGLGQAELGIVGVGLHGGASDVTIGKDSVTFTDADGAKQTVAAENVIVARGAHGDLSLAQSLEAAGFSVYAVGDANGVGYIEGAIRGADKAVREIAGAA